MFKVFETVSMSKECMRIMMIFISAAALLLVFNGFAMALSAPAADSFVYDLYDIGVNKILKGAPGFVIGCGAIAWGGSHLFKSAVVPAVTSMLGGGVILKADSIVTTLGMTIF